jgi:hypothetical protein
MTEPWPGKHDDRAPEHFLEDGVAPPVIGGGPPESPFDVEPEPEPPSRPVHQPPPRRRVEPPTNPIPVVRQDSRGQEEPKRKSWVARMFRLPGD